MLDKPDLPDETLVACLQRFYRSDFIQVKFLPLGADNHTAVYRAQDKAGRAYFVRLRSGNFDPSSVTLLQYLHEQGFRPIIAPIPTQIGALWAGLGHYQVMLYPYIEGQNMYETGLPDRVWFQFGEALRLLHSLNPPSEMAMRIRRENFHPVYRDSLRASLERAAIEFPQDPIAIQCTRLLRDRSAEIQALIERAERLAEHLQAREQALVLCHADLHAGNLLVETGSEPANDNLYIIDWDEIILAPKERDLMYIGGGLLGNWLTPEEEESLFYQGYGPTRIDPVAMAYYRYERILTDLAIYAQELLAGQGSREEREMSFRYMASNFFPGGVLEIARAADQAPAGPIHL